MLPSVDLDPASPGPKTLKWLDPFPMPESSYENLPASERTRWIVARRGSRSIPDVWRPPTSFPELERSATGHLLSTLTVLLHSRECPWHCLMCDLWKNTTLDPVPPGAIAAQVQHALAEHTPACPSPTSQIKLYNSGSFFDVGAIPPADYPAIAKSLHRFQRVIVECHPKLVNDRVLRFRDLLVRPDETLTPNPQLEIAMGLETTHPLALSRLNKGMTLEDFRRAADFLRRHDIDLRAFVLVQPPFIEPSKAVEWARRSAAFAFDCGATAVSLIPTRLGNGALDALQQTAGFIAPGLESLESALDESLRLGRGRVFADLWDIQKCAACAACLPARRARLETMNHQQVRLTPIICNTCGNSIFKPHQLATAR